MIERGFKYDCLTAADDASIEATRDRIYACPCGQGRWVSIQTGKVYTGNGGNEREQWWLQSQGPWVRIDKDQALDREQQARTSLRDELEFLKDHLAELIGAER